MFSISVQKLVRNCYELVGPAKNIMQGTCARVLVRPPVRALSLRSVCSTQLPLTSIHTRSVPAIPPPSLPFPCTLSPPPASVRPAVTSWLLVPSGQVGNDCWTFAREIKRVYRKKVA